MLAVGLRIKKVKIRVRGMVMVRKLASELRLRLGFVKIRFSVRD